MPKYATQVVQKPRDVFVYATIDCQMGSAATLGGGDAAPGDPISG